jgi:hypothetical protein
LLKDLGISAVQGVVHFSIPLWNTFAPSGVDVKEILSFVPVIIVAHEVVESVVPNTNAIKNVFFI